MKKGQKYKSITQDSQLNIRVTEDQLEELRRKAWDTGRSMANLIKSVLIEKKIISSVEE
jgi:hypothetical protein